MPNVLVETRGGWLGAKRTALLDAIHAATVEALCIPPDALVLRLVEHPMECFSIPHGAAEQYTHIVIAMFAGRSLSAKRALYQAIVRHLEPFGVPPGSFCTRSRAKMSACGAARPRSISSSAMRSESS